MSAEIGIPDVSLTASVRKHHPCFSSDRNISKLSVQVPIGPSSESRPLDEPTPHSDAVLRLLRASLLGIALATPRSQSVPTAQFLLGSFFGETGRSVSSAVSVMRGLKLANRISRKWPKMETL